MTNRPQVTIHYADGKPSEVRDMTDEEIAECEQAIRQMKHTEQVEPDAE